MDFNFKDIESLTVSLPEDIEKRKWAGDFEGAIRLCDLWLERPVPEVMKKKLVLEKDILKILPGEYPLTEEKVMEEVREKVPDFTHEEFEKLVDEGRIDFLFVNGREMYHEDCVATLFKVNADLIARADKAGELPETAKKDSAFENIRDKMIADGKATVRFHMHSGLKINDSAFRPGHVTVHLPIPVLCPQVRGVRITDCSADKYTVAAVDAAQRTICFDEEMNDNHELFVEYEYVITADYNPVYEEAEKAEAGATAGMTSSEKINVLDEPYPVSGGARSFTAKQATGAENGTKMQYCDPDFAEPMKKSDLDAFYRNVYRADLSEQLPHICFTPYMKALAADITRGKHSVLAKARAIYDYVTENVEYSFVRTYFTIESLAEYAAIGRRGDCGIQALMFITLCRIAGIPARWQSGLDTNPYDTGSHDWAMFYAEPYGWIFADPSFGGGAHRDGHEEERRFYFGNLDPFRTPTTRIFQSEFDPPRKYLRLDPYDNQCGEIEYDDRGLIKGEFRSSRRVLKYEAID